MSIESIFGPRSIEPAFNNSAQKLEAILGIDVSHYEPVPDYKRLKAHGVEFVYIKASEGTHLQDPLFEAHYMGAKDAGLLIGAYHFFHPAQNISIQFQNFTDVIKDKAFDLPLVVDWETNDDQDVEESAADVFRFMHYLELKFKRKPMLYAGESFLHDAQLPIEFAAYPLWLAHYGPKTAVKTPKPWGAWDVWQFSETFYVSGLRSNAVDANWTTLSLEELKRLGF